jgi:hypothetical protein
MQGLLDSSQVLYQQFFRVTHITGDKVTLGREGAGRHEEPVSWGKAHERRAVRFTIRPFCPPAHIHALPVDIDTTWAGEQWNPLV